MEAFESKIYCNGRHHEHLTVDLSRSKSESMRHLCYSKVYRNCRTDVKDKIEETRSEDASDRPILAGHDKSHVHIADTDVDRMPAHVAFQVPRSLPVQMDI